MNDSPDYLAFEVELRAPRPLPWGGRAKREKKPNKVELGVDDLVLCVTEPAFTADRDHDYWKLRLRLLCEALGVPGRGHMDLELAARTLPRRVNPMDGFLECPASLAQANNVIKSDDLLRQTERVFIELQSRFVRAIIDSIDPALSGRTTTLATLIELGLPEQEPRVEVDYDWI